MELLVLAAKVDAIVCLARYPYGFARQQYRPPQSALQAPLKVISSDHPALHTDRTNPALYPLINYSADAGVIEYDEAGFT